MGFILVLLLSFNYFYKNINHFKYQGLPFTKENYDKLPVFHYYYYFTDSAGQQYQYNLYLQTDPRKNDIPITGKIELPAEGDPVYVSINGTGLTDCKAASTGVATLAGFLVANLFDSKAGLADAAEAEKNNLTHIDCDTNPYDITIKLQAGEVTKITKEANCHIISIANCEVVPAIEKFEVQAILDAKARKAAEAKG